MTKNSTSFEAGNRVAEKHAGEGALKRLREGEPFVALAQEVYHEVLARWGFVEAELDKSGLKGDIIRETARQQTVTELLHRATLGAAEMGDLEKWERFIKRWGWRSDKSLAAMVRLAETLKGEDVLDYEALQSAGKDGS